VLKGVFECSTRSKQKSEGKRCQIVDLSNRPGRRIHIRHVKFIVITPSAMRDNDAACPQENCGAYPPSPAGTVDMASDGDASSNPDPWSPAPSTPSCSSSPSSPEADASSSPAPSPLPAGPFYQENDPPPNPEGFGRYRPRQR
jgi:hypothetical protein